jgi:hypothetical protein
MTATRRVTPEVSNVSVGAGELNSAKPLVTNANAGGAEMTYAAEATEESVYEPVPCEKALIVSLNATEIAPVYNVLRTVGVEPSVV